MFQLLGDIFSGGVARDMADESLEERRSFALWAVKKLIWPCFFLAIFGTGLAPALAK